MDMQVFIPYVEPIKVAECLDKKRLFNQVNECQVIIDNIEGASEGWKNHPAVKMWQPHKKWLMCYKNTLDLYYKGFPEAASLASKEALAYRPIWLTDKFCITHRRRLYNKSPKLYPQFKADGTSPFNYYVVDNQVLLYQNGRLVHTESLINYV